MYVTYVVITVLTIIANAVVAVAELYRAPFVLATSAEVGVPQSWFPPLAALKIAAACGLLLGLLGIRFLGIAAAIGLILYFTGALMAHVRARVFYNIYFPGAYWLLAIASLVLAIAV